MKSGGFAVQLGEDNPFGKIPVDQACEDTVNKDTKSPGGTKGFNLKPKAVNKYYLVAEYRRIFMRNWKEMLHLSKSSCHHNDVQKSRIARDEADVQSLLTTMEGWVNPCQGNVQDLICLSTGKMASDDVAGDLLQAKHLGERAFQSFSKERLEANSFHDSMSKAMLKTFKHKQEYGAPKRTAKEIVLKADRTLCARIIVIAEARQLSMKEVLSHPLGPLPWSLAALDGSLKKKTAKSSLAKRVAKRCSSS